MNLNKKRPRPVQHCTDGHPAQALLVHRYEHLGWIAHFPESLAGHLENGKFRSGTETVLDAAQKTIGAPIVTFKLKYDIHYMLQYLRTGYAPLFGDMSYQDYRYSGLFAESQKKGSSLTNLSYRTWGRLHIS